MTAKTEQHQGREGEEFKPGDRVRSPHGIGSVVGTRKGRVAVRLDGLAVYQADDLRHDTEKGAGE